MEVAKKNRELGMIRRTVISRDNDIILRLYKAFVRPHLEFAYEFGIHI